ncbi:MAG: hypothetical protein N2C14_14645, partial [Planctomycetales bacterium]
MKPRMLPITERDAKDSPENGGLHEETVRERYYQGAQKIVEEQCCPVQYNPQYLKMIPEEIL